MLEQLGERWDGPAWRWWALGAGVALAGAMLGIGAVLDGVRGIDGGPLGGVLIIGVLLIVCMLGSGMLDSVTNRMRSTGGAVSSGSGLQRRTPPGSQQRDEDDVAAAVARERTGASGGWRNRGSRGSRRHARGRNPALTDAEQARQDRRTIRCGLIALPLFVTLMMLLVG